MEASTAQEKPAHATVDVTEVIDIGKTYTRRR